LKPLIASYAAEGMEVHGEDDKASAPTPQICSRKSV
uniref:Transposase n=1 Tax=Echinostoma caproni TaxID=27848 RepID=A0A183B6J7_9TREM